MAHNPVQRFRSYDDLLAALVTARQRLAKGGAAPEPENGNGSRRKASANKLALVGASMLVIAALAFSGWWVTRSEEPPANDSTSAPGTASPCRTLAR